MSAADHLHPDQLSLFDMPASTPAAAPGGRQGRAGVHNPAGRSARSGKTPAPRTAPPHPINPMLQGGYQFKLFVDPEEHMAEMQSSSDAYGGTAQHYQSTMRSKLVESQMPEGMAHGGGLFEALHERGEQVRKPAHVIIDPEAHGMGDPYNRQGPMQWQGHHRIAAAAEAQRLGREAGVENWHKYVPVEYHQTAGHAIAAQEAAYDDDHLSTAGLAEAHRVGLRSTSHVPDHDWDDYEDNYTSTGNSTYWRDPTSIPRISTAKPMRKRYGTGTWNSKAY